MVDHLLTSNYVDDGIRATRVTTVDSTGAPTTGSQPAVQRVTNITRYAVGPVGASAHGTHNITAGKRSYSIAVLAAAGATPTLDGVALPAGWVGTFTVVLGGDSLEAAVLITAAGDDVIVCDLT